MSIHQVPASNQAGALDEAIRTVAETLAKDRCPRGAHLTEWPLVGVKDYCGSCYADAELPAQEIVQTLGPTFNQAVVYVATAEGFRAAVATTRDAAAAELAERHRFYGDVEVVENWANVNAPGARPRWLRFLRGSLIGGRLIEESIEEVPLTGPVIPAPRPASDTLTDEVEFFEAVDALDDERADTILGAMSRPMRQMLIDTLYGALGKAERSMDR